MQSRAVEILVGLFVCLGIAAIFILTYRVSNLADSGASSGYTLTAAFNDVGGLKAGAPVELAGVRIGQVTSIKLDQTTYQAVAKLRIENQYKIPQGSDAEILTSGLLGSQYVGIGPGGSLQNMKNGDKFQITQSAIVLENLIGQFMSSFGSHSSGGSSSASSGGSSANSSASGSDSSPMSAAGAGGK